MMTFIEYTGGTSYKAWLRGTLAVVIAVLTSLLSKWEEMGVVAVVFAILQGLICWRAFLDQSLGDTPKA